MTMMIPAPFEQQQEDEEMLVPHQELPAADAAQPMEGETESLHPCACFGWLGGFGLHELNLVFEGKDEQIDLKVFTFTGTGGVALSMYNTDENLERSMKLKELLGKPKLKRLPRSKPIEAPEPFPLYVEEKQVYPSKICRDMNYN
ncbi:hypothetical protein GUJ93_ZPchr0013g37150 [Zizania palustris]|uniref:Uncharacterized protein n=1 Tax=Zizania palustris TaxID=103762 RepID=A0A8J6C3P0_ZIZPA|nr:hypothetical protein GUJ93_ZPchr0013g37150 [Zizania palustris]